VSQNSLRDKAVNIALKQLTLVFCVTLSSNKQNNSVFVRSVVDYLAAGDAKGAEVSARVVVDKDTSETRSREELINPAINKLFRRPEPCLAITLPSINREDHTLLACV